ncbi:DUF1294 domain-containing protein [Chryseobacterium sp. FH1]|uniref:DUF1294 domain-containing protein n=1 Tax=Chryseobacterium sp. FH1 TaxID=1233951 RepID=UPI0004E3AB5F|nr:DUF1294 domain-containing protein [Chryseobacterium sp. FH1]KFC18271.1 hypothetical protein IO90_18810 [Chryseobacterium sp. FH1]
MIFYLITISVISIILFGIDKWKAKKHQRRISESMLLLISFLGASLGSVLGMLIFNHKISKPGFWLRLMVVVIVQILALIYLLPDMYSSR